MTGGYGSKAGNDGNNSNSHQNICNGFILLIESIIHSLFCYYFIATVESFGAAVVLSAGVAVVPAPAADNLWIYIVIFHLSSGFTCEACDP